MLTEVLPKLYKLEIPLPNNPLKALNAYVFKGKDRNLIVDTGMNREECKSVMLSGLREIDIDLKKTDFFITHMHADHAGLISSLQTETSKVYCSEPDARRINFSDQWDKTLANARLNGFPESDLQEAYKNHPGNKYQSRGMIDFNIFREGNTLDAGEYSLCCIETPGHTAGHLCLYEKENKILVAGDHLLKDITPNISAWADDRDPLKEYLQSLDKILSFDIHLVLPGHRSLFKDSRQRVEELKAHHTNRTEEILSILAKGAQDAFQVAARMSWDLTYTTWEMFPVQQKWFAAGEALAHLIYLQGQEKIKSCRKEDKIKYYL